MTKDWEDVREYVCKLYHEDGLSLSKIEKRLRQERDFKASTRAYRMKLKEWKAKRDDRLPEKIESATIVTSEKPDVITDHAEGTDCSQSQNTQFASLLEAAVDSEVLTGSTPNQKALRSSDDREHSVGPNSNDVVKPHASIDWVSVVKGKDAQIFKLLREAQRLMTVLNGRDAENVAMNDEITRLNQSIALVRRDLYRGLSHYNWEPPSYPQQQGDNDGLVPPDALAPPPKPLSSDPSSLASGFSLDGMAPVSLDMFDSLDPGHWEPWPGV